jgi:hypothetical protein
MERIVYEVVLNERIVINSDAGLGYAEIFIS